MKIIEPYEHDCKKCRWVGWFCPTKDFPPMNVYLCKRDNGKETVIIRYSSDGPDYWSMTEGGIKGPLEFFEGGN